jgi:hypothetical protein
MPGAAPLPSFLPLTHSRIDNGSPTTTDAEGKQPAPYTAEGGMMSYYVPKGHKSGGYASPTPGSPSGRPDSPVHSPLDGSDRQSLNRKDFMNMYNRRDFDARGGTPDRNGKRKRGQLGDNNTEQAEEVRKERHNMAEKKRRSDMNDAIERLRALLPQQVTAEKRLTKVEVLIEAADHLTQVQNLCAKLIAENNGLMKQRPPPLAGVSAGVPGAGVVSRMGDDGDGVDAEGAEEEENRERRGRDVVVGGRPRTEGVDVDVTKDREPRGMDDLDAEEEEGSLPRST